MQAKQYFTAALALGFAAVGVSGNYMPDITHLLQEQSGVVFDGATDEYVPGAVVNRVAQLDRITLPSYEGSERAEIFAENNSFALRQGGEVIDSYTFMDDNGELMTASVNDGTLVFTNSDGTVVTDFYIGYEHIVYDVNGDIHTPGGVLCRTTETPREQSVEELAAMLDKDVGYFKALDEYIGGGELDETVYGTPDELVANINSLYLDIDKYSGYVSSYNDDEVKEKLQAVMSLLEEMTAVVNTSPCTQGSGTELNMNKLIILSSVLNNTLEQKGITVQPEQGSESGSDDTDISDSTTTTTTKKATTTKKSTTTTTKKKTQKKTSSTTEMTGAETQPQATQQVTQQQTQQQTTQPPVTTTVRKPVVTVTTTTAPRFTIKEYSKTIYALRDGKFYDQPDLTSEYRGSFEKYYNASCTGETSNGYYRLAVKTSQGNYVTVYVPMSDFSTDPNTTLITTTAPKIKTGNINKYSKEMLKYINALRKEYGIDEVKGYETLDKAADIRAKELKTLFEHTRPDSTKYSTVLKQVGINGGRSGENITYGMNTSFTVEEAFNKWKSSQKHLENMLDPDFKYMSIGYYTYTDKDGNDYNYWVMLLYTP